MKPTVDSEFEGRKAHAGEDGTRERILDMALRLSRRPATAGFTLEQLADRLNLHYTAIYHYFKGRDDLACALLEGICQRRMALLNEAQVVSGSALEQLCGFISSDLKEPPTDVPQRSIALLKEPFRARANEAQVEITGRIAALLERGVVEGSIETDSTLVTGEIIHRVLNRYRNRGEWLLRGQTLARLTQVVIDLVCHGIAVDGQQFAPSTAVQPRPFPVIHSTDKELDKVVRALTAEFNRCGYAGTSVPRVAQSIGLSKTSFYKYGSSKEALLFLCAQQTMNLVAQVRQISKVVTADPVQGLLYNLYYARCLHSRSPGPTLMPANFRSLTAEHELVMWETFRRWRDDLLGLIEAGIEAGQIRAMEPSLMLPLMSICSSLEIESEPVESGFGDEVARFLYRGISTRRAS